jgi:pantoate--beta-alanine ligase
MARAPIEAVATSIDYVTCADAISVTPLADDAQIERTAVLAVAARVGTTRLIDNVVLGEDPSPITS